MTKCSIIPSDNFKIGSYRNKTEGNLKLKGFKETLHGLNLCGTSHKNKEQETQLNKAYNF